MSWLILCSFSSIITSISSSSSSPDQSPAVVRDGIWEIKSPASRLVAAADEINLARPRAPGGARPVNAATWPAGVSRSLPPDDRPAADDDRVGRLILRTPTQLDANEQNEIEAGAWPRITWWSRDEARFRPARVLRAIHASNGTAEFACGHDAFDSQCCVRSASICRTPAELATNQLLADFCVAEFTLWNCYLFIY